MIITIESIEIEPEAACDIYRATHLKRENHLGSRPLWKDLGTNLPRDGSRPELKRGHVGEYTENRRRVEEWHRGAQSERLAHEDESEREPSGEHATRAEEEELPTPKLLHERHRGRHGERVHERG